MNERDDFERTVHDWLTDDATRPAPPRLLDGITETARSRRSRYGWLTAMRGEGMDAPIRLGSGNVRPLILLALLGALVIGMVAGTLVAGGGLRPPLAVVSTPTAAPS